MLSKFLISMNWNCQTCLYAWDSICALGLIGCLLYSFWVLHKTDCFKKVAKLWLVGIFGCSACFYAGSFVIKSSDAYSVQMQSKVSSLIVNK